MARYRYSNKGWIWGLVLGIVVTIAIFCIVVGIASSINNVSFGQQIVNWFGKTAETAKEVVDTAGTTPQV